MLTKSELVGVIAEELDAAKSDVREVLDLLAEVAEDEISQGNDFTIPGIGKIKFNYTPPLKKGEKYKKGETYIGFGGIENVAEADSKARKQSIKLRALPHATLKKMAQQPAVTKKAIALRK